MRIALAQINYHIGNFDSNVEKVLAAIEKAKTESADLIVFAELAITGYPPRDFLEFDEFIEMSDAAILQIAEKSHGIGVIIGAPTKNLNSNAKLIWNQ